MNIQLILTIILSVVWTYYTAKIDADHILKKEYITNHRSRFLSRVMVGVLVGLLNWKAGLIVGFTFWTFFDFYLNYFRNLPFTYIGTTATLDKYFQSKKYLYYLSKFISLIFIILLILI